MAATVLARALTGGAFAAAALDAELERAVQLEARDRALATELVYGSLRLFPWLEARVGRHAKRGLAGVDPVVRAHLVIACYQMLVLTKIPAFAAVNEAVSLIRAAKGEKVSGFANAVLRKVAAEARPTADELEHAALASVEPSLCDALVRAIGEDGARRLVGGGGAQEGPPPAGLRVEDATARSAWIARWQEARPSATFEPGSVSPHAVNARNAGRVVELPGYDEGAFTPQEEGSQLVALALGAREGEIVLDACAGRGNKTGLLAHQVGRSGAVDAVDVAPKKLDRLRKELARVGVGPRSTFAVDWSAGPGDVVGPYDRVLVDAPCSGTGTLRRRPDLLLRRVFADARDLSKLQQAILERAATVVKPGGRIVYSVCSVLREEAEDVVSAVAPRAGLSPVPFDSPSARAIAGEAAAFRLLPHIHGTDGYFIASFMRTHESHR